MSSILTDRSFRLSIILTLIFLGIGLLFLLLGIAEYNWVLFGLLPIVLGIAIGALPNRGWAYFGVGFGIVCFLFFLLIGQMAGFLCVIMSMGIMVPFIFLGTLIVHLARRYKELKNPPGLPVLLLPLLVFLIAAPIEHFLTGQKKEVVEVKTEKIFNYTPEQVYDAIKSVDTLIAEKPFLMKLDLPVPVKCVLQKEEVGGLRTCYFSSGRLSRGDFGSGTITEKITRLERAKVLQMDVISYNLIGRNWLGFKQAIYYFEKVGDGSCKLTRITTYTSELTPRFYWEPLEKMGIRQEHDYVFNNLLNDLHRKYGPPHP